MTAVKPRKPTRRERAAATRTRMIEAAQEVFADQGYVGARMADIAARAGVAVQTVYFVFHTKPELLQACYEHAVLGPEGVPPPRQSFWTQIRTAGSGSDALAAFAHGNVLICSRAAAVDEVAKAARHEPEVLEVRTRSEQLRREGYAELITYLAGQGWLRRDIDVERATDVTLVLGSPSTYLELRGYGWTDDQISGWLADLLVDQLL